MRGVRRVRLKPSTEDVRRILLRLRDDLLRSGVGEGLLDRAELVLAEALNNVVEHAQRDRPEGRIELEAGFADGVLTLCLFDDGRAMPGEELPAGDLPTAAEPARDMPEGGFGWYLIRCLADELDYRRTGEGNCLRIRLVDVAGR